MNVYDYIGKADARGCGGCKEKLSAAVAAVSGAVAKGESALTAGWPSALLRLEEKPAAPTTFRISAILPARDEGDQVRLTCESFLAAGVDEIVVLDDGSTDGSCNPQILKLVRRSLGEVESSSLFDEALAKSNPQIRVLRNEAAAGVGRARNQGAAAATGDVLIFADAHMRADADLRAFALAALERDAIVCAAVKPLGGEGDWTGYGGRLAPDRDGAGYAVEYNMKRPAERLSPVGAVIGACYAVPRSAFERMGGWPPTLGWGYNEQAFSMAAWLCGVAMLCDRDTVVRHRFKKRFNYPASLAAARLNRFLVHRVLFDEATFADHWLPRLRAAYPEVAAQADAMLAGDELAARAAAFRARKVSGDAAFLAAHPPEPTAFASGEQARRDGTMVKA